MITTCSAFWRFTNASRLKWSLGLAGVLKRRVSYCVRRLDCADLGRKPEEHGDDVVRGGETPFLGERCDVAVTDGGDGDEGVVDGVEERVAHDATLRVGVEAYDGRWRESRHPKENTKRTSSATVITISRSRHSMKASRQSFMFRRKRKKKKVRSSTMK